MPKLYAARYNTDGTSMLEFFDDPADIGMRWSLPFGPERAEVTVRPKGAFDPYQRYTEHLGNRFCVLDDKLDYPVFDGWVYEVRPDGPFITYIIGGPFFRHKDAYYQESDLPAAGGDTDAIIKDVLTDTVSVMSSDQTHIDATGTDSESWEPEEHGGQFATDIIPDLALMSDTGADIWDYWAQSAPLAGILPQAPLPYFSKRDSTAATDWIIEAADLGRRGARLSRNIFNLKRTVTVHYGLLTGTHGGIANSANLVDNAGRNFINEGAAVGDKVINVTDGSDSLVQGIIDQGAGTKNSLECVLTGGTDDDWDAGDVFSLKLEKGHPTQIVTASSSETDLWSVEITLHQSNMTQTQAEQFRDMLLAQFEKPTTQQAFTVTSPYIKSGKGTKFPLWEPIKKGGGYVRADIFPAAALFTLALDRRQAFRIVAMDYNYKRNRLRIVPDTEDSRLDAILKRGRLIQSEQVQA